METVQSHPLHILNNKDLRLWDLKMNTSTITSHFSYSYSWRCPRLLVNFPFLGSIIINYPYLAVWVAILLENGTSNDQISTKWPKVTRKVLVSETLKFITFIRSSSASNWKPIIQWIFQLYLFQWCYWDITITNRYNIITPNHFPVIPSLMVTLFYTSK